MPKRSNRARSKFQPAPPLSRALSKKEHDARFMQLLKASRENGRMARRMASLMGLTPTEIPAALIREMRAAAKRASEPASRKPSRLER